VTIRIPFDSVKAWGARGQLRVRGDINGFEFRTSLFPTGDGHHYMVVNKEMQKGGRVGPDEEARFHMEPDPEKRILPEIPELERILKSSKRLRKFYDALSPSAKFEISRMIAQGKHAETRVRRAEQLAERLMETMEAEVDLPPIIRQAFLRNPKAEEIWQRMSPSHRRAHLLGIFYYRDPASRLRRIEKAIAYMENRTGRDLE
jgi:uncharacterized protein YdeI (YjbR/CyaY-like superfamily)